MIRQVTPVANAEIAIGRKTAVLNATAQRTRSVSTAKIEPERGDERRHDRDPDRVVLDRRRQRRGREQRLVVVDPDPAGRRSRSARRSCGRSCRRSGRGARRASRKIAGARKKRARQVAAEPSRLGRGRRSRRDRRLRRDPPCAQRATCPSCTPRPPQPRAASAIPVTLLGFFRNVWKSPHSPWPVVEPNDAGCSSDMSKTTDFAVS